jgi:broad specificity phosphatase PhoE
MGDGKTTLFFIRHGQTNNLGGDNAIRLNGWTDCPLSRSGIEQAERVALRLRNEGPFDCVYSSPLRRALDTAKPIAAVTRLALRVCDGLREIHCGALEGADVDEVQRRFPSIWGANLAQTDQDFRWPGGESYREFRDRCLGTLGEIAQTHAGRRIVVVTHAGVVSQLVGHISGVSAARWGAYRPHNATLTEVEWQAGSWRVLRFDDGVHLLADHVQQPVINSPTARRLAG